MEHARTKDHSGVVHQWVEEQRAIVIDTVTGELRRFSRQLNAVGTVPEALELMTGCTTGRYIIVKLDCIVPYIVESMGSK